MKRLSTMVAWLLAVAFTCTGCMSTAYYLPQDPTLARETRASCGGSPSGHAELTFAPGRSATVFIKPQADRLLVFWQVRVQAGQSFRLAEPAMTLESTEGLPSRHVIPLGDWTSEVHGARGVLRYKKTVPANVPITGELAPSEEIGRSLAFGLYNMQGQVSTRPAPAYRVILPAMEVDGQPFTQPPFVVNLRKHTSIYQCLQ